MHAAITIVCSRQALPLRCLDSRATSRATPAPRRGRCSFHRRGGRQAIWDARTLHARSKDPSPFTFLAHRGGRVERTAGESASDFKHMGVVECLHKGVPPAMYQVLAVAKRRHARRIPRRRRTFRAIIEDARPCFLLHIKQPSVCTRIQSTLGLRLGTTEDRNATVSACCTRASARARHRR